MARIAQGVKVRRLPRLRPVLQRWISINREYSRRLDWKECGWWYNERASIGFLAAAVWLSRQVALEEFVTKKGRGKDRHSGRCDLYLSVGGEHFLVEAKHVWVAVRGDGAGVSQIEAQLKTACSEVRQVADPVRRRVGIVFAVPRLPRPYDGAMIAGWLREVASLSADAMAWVFPQQTRQLRGDDGYLYPGVVILVRSAL